MCNTVNKCNFHSPSFYSQMVTETPLQVIWWKVDIDYLVLKLFFHFVVVLNNFLPFWHWYMSQLTHSCEHCAIVTILWLKYWVNDYNLISIFQFDNKHYFEFQCLIVKSTNLLIRHGYNQKIFWLQIENFLIYTG